jgi:ABC-2 type transport system ATP-binding protein
MSPGIEVRDLRLHYGRTVALDGLTFRLDGGKVYGLLGRNGSGKTSLLSLVSAFRRASAGEVLVGGANPFENAAVVRDICFIRDRVDVTNEEKVRAALAYARDVRPNWDAAYADKLVNLFRLPLTKSVSALSRGQRSALGITLGLATRAPLTIFDESYLGMDAPSRYTFYDELLSDYLANPRTIIISTHLIEEVGSLFEEVVIIDRGRLVVHEQADVLRARGGSVTGPAADVDRLVEELSTHHGLTVLSEQRLGGTKSTTVYGELDEPAAARVRAAGLELGPVALQDLFVHLTRPGDDISRTSFDRPENSR